MTQQRPLVAVLGANGRLGLSLVHAFSLAGWRVRAHSRDTGKGHSRPWPENVEPLICDARERLALMRGVRGVDVVVNALNPPYTQWDKNALELGANAIAAARAAGSLLLFPGNIYNFGNQLPATLTVETPQIANTTKAHLRIEMEKSLKKASEEGLDCIVLRGGDYFGGESRGAWFDRVITKHIGKRKVIYPGSTDRSHAWAYLPDFAETFVRVASLKNRPRGFHVYHFPGYTLTGAQLHHALEQALGISLNLKGMPWRSLKLASCVSPMARSLLEMRYLWERSHRIQDGALSELIGSLPSTPLRDALRASLQSLDLIPT